MRSMRSMRRVQRCRSPFPPGVRARRAERRGASSCADGGRVRSRAVMFLKISVSPSLARPLSRGRGRGRGRSRWTSRGSFRSRVCMDFMRNEPLSCAGFFLILRVRGAFFSTSPWLWDEKVGESFIGRKSKSKSKSKSKGCREL